MCFQEFQVEIFLSTLSIGIETDLVCNISNGTRLIVVRHGLQSNVLEKCLLIFLYLKINLGESLFIRMKDQKRH